MTTTERETNGDFCPPAVVALDERASGRPIYSSVQPVQRNGMTASSKATGGT
jgi:hypothetical protein